MIYKHWGIDNAKAGHGKSRQQVKTIALKILSEIKAC